MTSAARDLLELRSLLQEHLGAEATDKLMDFLPGMPISDLATHQDVDALRVATGREFSLVRGEISAMRTETRQEFSLVRGEIDALRTETRHEFALVRGEISALRTEMHQGSAILKTELEAKIDRAVVTQIRWMVGLLVPLLIAGISANAVVVTLLAH